MNLLGLPQRLDDDLIIKACRSVDEIELVAALNAEIHGPAEGEAIRRWLLDGHPQLEPGGWLFVEDERDGAVAATLCLMPLTWRYGSAPLPVAELGFVATHPTYRQRGLQRALSAAFDRVALANDFSLSAIEGIPYFYRQFGYDYAVPLIPDSRFRLELGQIPVGLSPEYIMRPAIAADIPQLQTLYRKQNAGLVISTERSEAMWRHYLTSSFVAPFGMRLSMIIRDERSIGYLALAPSGWSDRLNVIELALDADHEEVILAALRFARIQAEAGEHAGVGLQLPVAHPASQWARAMGVKDEGEYGWQMKVLDPVRFLNVIAPALERRLLGTESEGLSGDLSFDLYRQKLGLRFQDGRVKALPLPPDAPADVNLPPFAATQLWLGWRSFAALDDWHKDVRARDESRSLLNLLFPPLEGAAHIYPGY